MVASFTTKLYNYTYLTASLPPALYCKESIGGQHGTATTVQKLNVDEATITFHICHSLIV